MRVLNLVNAENNVISHKVSKFPDGQQQVQILSAPGTLENEEVRIYTRIEDFRDVEILACTVASLRNLKVKDIHLDVPYFLGSRSDRKFEEGSNNYLKSVMCPIINAMNFASVRVIDPHSTTLENCLTNFDSFDNSALVIKALDEIYGREILTKWSEVQKRFCIVSPDAGATKKVEALAEQLNFQGDIITCRKHRGVDGKLSQTMVPISLQQLEKDLFIVDDICDGGRTFINIIEALNKHKEFYGSDRHYGKIYLVVTHGIFSQGFEELGKHIDHIFCTNSYSDLDETKDYLYHEHEVKPGKRFVTQLNVF